MSTPSGGEIETAAAPASRPAELTGRSSQTERDVELQLVAGHDPLADLGDALLEEIGDLPHVGRGQNERRRERGVVDRGANEEPPPPRRLLHRRAERLLRRERPA